MRRISSTRARRGAIAGAALAVVGLVATGPEASAGHQPKPPKPYTVSVVPGLEGLAGPFGLDVVGNRIYVGEQGAPPDEETGFPGLPGSISVWKRGTKSVIANFDGQGPSDVSVRNPADISYTIGAQGPDFTVGNDLGRIVRGNLQTPIDLGINEIENNPDADQGYGPIDGVPADCLELVPDALLEMLQEYNGGLDSNVYSVDTVPFSTDRFVTDAAANAVYRIHDGEIAQTWVLPPVIQTVTAEGLAAINQELPPDQQAPECLIGLEWAGEPVPTSVVVGPDWGLYVTSLPGFPEQPGTSGIFRINPWNGEITRWVDGLTSAVDLTFDHRGNAYVAEIFGGSFGAGAIKKIDTSWTWRGLKAGTVSTIVEANPTPGGNVLMIPSRVAVGADGTIYATNNLFGEGNVVKITR